MNREIQKPLNPARSLGIQVGATVSAYISLTKPRIIALLLLVTVATMAIAAVDPLPLQLIALTVLGGALMSGAANALNCYYDRDIDSIMSRTRNRPLVTGVINPPQALVFAVSLAIIACLVFTFGVNVLSGALAFAGLLVYVLVYTPLKRSSPFSVIVGAIAGAAPPLVAWAAVRHSLDLTALLLFAIMKVWQIPHTLALSLLLYNDYVRARVPVSPVKRGIKAAQREIMVYSCLLWGLSLVPGALGLFGPVYLLGAILLGTRFAALAFDGLFPAAVRNDLRLYKFSLLYLALLFLLMTADRMLHTFGAG
jgi:protoheme IX farnesyltransferase